MASGCVVWMAVGGLTSGVGRNDGVGAAAASRVLVVVGSGHNGVVVVRRGMAGLCGWSSVRFSSLSA